MSYLYLIIEPVNYLSSCPCESHLAKVYAEKSFAFPVTQLFELSFGDNSFTRAYHEAQKLLGKPSNKKTAIYPFLLEYTSSDWHKNPETGKRERQVNYKTVTQSILGTNTISCNEKQVCLTSDFSLV